MKSLTIIPSVIGLFLVGALATPAHADECNELTYLTFSAPVALPGVTLPAGTYRFMHPDCATTVGVVRVSSQDGTHVYGTFQIIPEERTTPSVEPEVVFGEMPAGSPEAIKAWFYPGETTGDEFVYPTNEAPTVAEAPAQEVFATDGLR